MLSYDQTPESFASVSWRFEDFKFMHHSIMTDSEI